MKKGYIQTRQCKPDFRRLSMFFLPRSNQIDRVARVLPPSLVTWRVENGRCQPRLAETAFNPEYGLFRVTEERLLFPNPEAWKYHDAGLSAASMLGFP